MRLFVGLQEIKIDSLTDDQKKKLNDSYDHISNKENPHEVKLKQLKDIIFGSLLDGDALVYDLTTDTWKNKTITIEQDGKIKLNLNGNLDYLENLLDGTTLSVVNDKLIAKSLDGLTVSIAEINTLQGMTGNVKSILDTLSSAGMAFKGVVSTKADLLALTDMQNGYVYIVQADESDTDSPTNTYVYDGTDWLLIGKTTIQVRDFSVNPIDLTKEVIGILPQDKMDLTDLARISQLDNYLDKANYDINGNGIIDKAETLEGLNKTVSQLNSDIGIDSILAGDNIEITKDTSNNTVTISGKGGKDYDLITEADINSILGRV